MRSNNRKGRNCKDMDKIGIGRVPYDEKHFQDQLQTPLKFKGDKLKVQWQADFYEQKRKFRRDLQAWKEQLKQVPTET